MIVAGKVVRGSGRISDALTHVMDVPATFLSVAGVTYPKTYQGQTIAPLQGKSLVPVLNQSRATVRGPSDWLGFELFGNRAVRQGKWKLLWLCRPAGPGEWQLYDLTADPGETKDVAAQNPKIREALLGRWNEYVRANNVILPSASPVCAKAQ